MRPKALHTRSLSTGSKLAISTIFQSERTAKQAQFVPFQNQRDKLGRLLSSSAKTSQQYQSLHQPKGHSYSKSQLSDRKIMESFSKKCYDQPILFPQSRLHKRQTITSHLDGGRAKCTFIQSSLLEDPEMHRIKVQITRPEGQHKLKLRKCQTANTIQRKQPSSSKQRPKIRIEAESQSRPHQKSKQKLHLPNNARKKGPPDCPEVVRYRQMQKLSAQIFPDFVENHNKFLVKIQQSKRLAFKIKKELNL